MRPAVEVMWTRAPLPCSRKWAAAERAMLKAPNRCTRSTDSKSAAVILWKMESRRMPALCTTASMRPKLATARSTMPLAESQSATLPPSARACPPAASISATTSCAGEVSARSPASDTPRSLTTTLAPWRAASSATPLPTPPPAPVTITTLPLSSSVDAVMALAFFSSDEEWRLLCASGWRSSPAISTLCHNKKSSLRMLRSIGFPALHEPSHPAAESPARLRSRRQD